MKSRKTRVLIVDDHAIVRKGLAMVVSTEEDFEVVGEVENGYRALDLVQMLNPHVVLLDLIMPEMDGVATAMALRTAAPEVQVIVLTGGELNNGFPKILARVLAAGVHNYVPKNARPCELLEAIRTVACGTSYIHPTVEYQMLCQHETEKQRSMNGCADLHLTPREREVLHWMATPATYREIAEYMRLSEETVRSHAKNILVKLRQPNRSQAVLQGLKYGFIELSR